MRTRTFEPGCTIFAAMALGACMSSPWGVDTLCIVEDIDQATEEQLIVALSAEPKCYGFEVVSRRENGGSFEFLLTGVDDLSVLHDVKTTIARVSEKSNVPLELQHTAVTFASVSGRANTQIRVVGTATPGARVTLDVGTTTVTTPVDTSGTWTAGIERNSDLSNRGGWIYGLIQKGNARKFIRMNVLDTDGCEDIRAEDLPEDSLLRTH